MSKYIVKRVFLAVATLLIVCGITFFSMNAIPGGPFDGEKATSPAVRAVLEQRFNLDKPVPERCLPIRKHRGAREKRYSFGYAVFLILALMK